MHNDAIANKVIGIARIDKINNLKRINKIGADRLQLLARTCLA